MPEGIPVHGHKLNYRILVRILGNKKERFSSLRREAGEH